MRKPTDHNLKEVAFASNTVIVVVEEIVDEAVIRADPKRTPIPGLIVDAIVHNPYEFEAAPQGIEP